MENIPAVLTECSEAERVCGNSNAPADGSLLDESDAVTETVNNRVRFREVRGGMENRGGASDSVAVEAMGDEDGQAVPSSMHLPCKIMGRVVHMMVDSGCTNSIISKSIFDQLPAATRGLLRPGHSRAVLADGSNAKIFGEISLPV